MKSHVAVLGCRNGMELGRQGLEVTVLSKVVLRINQRPLSLGLEVDLGRTKRVFLGDEVVFIDSF